jgi:hypothetical protein
MHKIMGQSEKRKSESGKIAGRKKAQKAQMGAIEVLSCEFLVFS